MTLKYTTWGPDTCSCRITYEWDDEVDPAVRTHTQIAVANKCAVHAAVLDNSLYQMAIDENRRKNLTGSIARVELGKQPGDAMDWYSWAFTTGRVLQVTFLGINVNQSIKMRIQNVADLQFGPGKVEIL